LSYTRVALGIGQAISNAKLKM